LGYNAERITLNGQSLVDIKLVPDITKLDEVVVIGYGTVKKSDLTGSVKVLNNNNIADVSAIGLDQMLQGNAAGVQVTTASGEPGAGVRIRIRGGNSINGDNSPLYVIDGFPISNNQMGDAKGLGQSGQAINPLSSIDPADIVGMQVLKDASATAIYGSRGANGVIIITTKRGKKGGMTVDFGASMSSSIIRKKLEMLQAFDFATLANTIVKTGGQAAEYANPETLQTINWQDEIFQTAVSQNYNLSVTGGNEATKVALGINWLDQNGVLKNSAFKRGNVRMNVDHTISKIIRTGANINISTSNGALGQTNEGIGNASLSSIGTALTFQPFEVALDDPTYNEKILKDPREMVKVTDDYNNVRVLSGAWAEIDILPSLKLKGNFGGDFSTSDRDRFWPKTTRWGASMNGVSSHTNSNFYSYLSEYTLTYSKNIEDHSFTGLAGYTWQNFVNKYGYQQSNNFIDDGLGAWGMENGTSYLPPAYYKDESNLISWLARVNYDYKKRYYVTFSGRYDGSSKFGANNKWALFPSTALAWKVSEEPFMKNLNIFSSLKLRASIGQSGSQAIGAYQSLVKIYGANTANNGTIVAGTQVGNLSNPDLSWETTTQSDLGVDIAFFNNRLRFSFDYYNKVTRDLLLQKQIPISSGFGSIWTNFGEIRNNGLEIEVGANIIETDNLNWETDANISFNRNTVLELGMPAGDNGYVEYYSTNIHSYNGIRAPGHVSREGEPVAQFYGYRTDGLYRTTEEVTNALPGENAYLGGLRRKDLNNDKKIDKLDQTIIGSPHPDLIFGITNTFIYKNWDLQFMVTGSIGNEIYNANLNSIATMRDNKNNVLKSVYFDSWSPDRPDAKYPAPNQAAIADISSDYLIEDGSYVRLKSLEIGYRIPTKVSWIKQAKIIVSATNLFTITDYSGYDPEVDSFSGDNLRPGVDYNSYPTSRTYKLGVNFTF
jgi:TonB-linked SusC/RagA family outer membrane protein